jgi:L-malate glycosyltransferase
VRPARVLHCHSTFSLGGKEARAVRLMNAFGDRAEHTILSAVPGALDARDAIDAAIKVEFPGGRAPSLIGKPGPSRYRAMARYLADFDLVLSYNWGSMDAAGARWLFPKGCPPLIHHEDGFNPDEARKLNWKRNLFRRIALRTADRLIVPSVTLARIAAEHWGRADAVRIPNGIDVARYAGPPVPRAIPGFERQPGDIWVGTIAGLRSVKNIPRLVRAVAAQPAHVKLVVAGEGPDRAAILAEAERLGMGDRLLLAGFLSEPHRYVGHFDIFALSSDSEQFPISMIEAMAAGKPVFSTAVGDIRHMLPPSNVPFLAAPEDEAGFAMALSALVADEGLRAKLGADNQALAVAQYDETGMINRYAALYGEACGFAFQ